MSVLVEQQRQSQEYMLKALATGEIAVFSKGLGHGLLRPVQSCRMRFEVRGCASSKL